MCKQISKFDFKYLAVHTDFNYVSKFIIIFYIVNLVFVLPELDVRSGDLS